MNKKKEHEHFYAKNKKYADFCESQERDTFRKYSDYIIKYSSQGQRIVDVGCGTGIALELVQEAGTRDLYGIEIADESIKVCKEKKLRCVVYDGKRLPYKDNYFHLVGSVNVLEHTDDPVGFLNEQLRVLRPGGYLIISCPNFLSITNSYHHHTRGITRKLRNFLSITSRVAKPRQSFEKMETIVREDFQPDDDACNVTNPQDILQWGKTKQMEMIEWSSQPQYAAGIKSSLDRSFLRLFFGAAFIVLKKHAK